MRQTLRLLIPRGMTGSARKAKEELRAPGNKARREENKEKKRAGGGSLSLLKATAWPAPAATTRTGRPQSTRSIGSVDRLVRACARARAALAIPPGRLDLAVCLVQEKELSPTFWLLHCEKMIDRSPLLPADRCTTSEARALSRSRASTTLPAGQIYIIRSRAIKNKKKPARRQHACSW